MLCCSFMLVCDRSSVQPPSVLARLTSAATGKSLVAETLPDGSTSIIPWRAAGVKHSLNEIYLDVVEEVDCSLDCRGNVVTMEVAGVIEANAQLSGVPDLSLQVTTNSLQ